MQKLDVLMQKLNRILIELQPIAPAKQTRRLRAPHRGVDTGFILEKKNRAQSIHLLQITPNGRTYGHFFNFSNH